MSNFMNDPSLTGGRRVINYGAHGNIANQSLNQRIFEGIENLNNSNRFDNHFDQSQDDRPSSRGAYDYKRSETDVKQMQQVHFAPDGNPRNHPLHMKHSATMGGSGLNKLERIDERKSQSPSMRSKVLGKGGNSKQNLNDISNITINSKNLEDSVKAPNRPPVRIDGLTEFLVESHYKRFGVYSKVEPELFKYWKEYISLAYKEERKKKAQLSALYQSQISSGDAAAKQDSTGQPLFNSKGIPEKRKEKFANSKGFYLQEKFGSLYEMDVAYTLQQDFKEESKKQQTEREQLITSKKEAREKYIKEQEDAMIKLSCELFFTDKIEFMIWCSAQKDLKDKSEDEKLKYWYKAVIDWKLQPINDGSITKLTDSLSKNGQSAAEATQEEKKKAEQLKKEKQATKAEEEKKKNEETKVLRESLRKEINKEQELIKNLFIYIRGKVSNEEAIPNDATVAQRMYRDAKEKAQNGLIWPKGDQDAEVVIGRFFRAECLIRRLQILYEHKLDREGKYRHLSLFGFYIQISQRDRSLFLIDRKLVEAPLSFDAQAYNNSFKAVLEKASSQAQKLHEQQQSVPQNQITRAMQEALHDQIQTSQELAAVELTRTKLSESLSDNKQVTMSVQEIINDYENNYKAEVQIRQWIDHIKLKRKQKQVHEKTLEEVFGKEKKQQIDKQLKEQKTIERLGVLAKPKDKWKRLRILMELKKQFAHDITLQKMIKEELKSNRVFKFPEEYDLYDDQEDKLCKHQGEKSIKQYDNKLAQTLRDKFKEIDDQKLYYLKKEVASKRQQERQMENYLLEQALKYLEEKKKRLSGQTTTIREFVSKVYQEIAEKFKELVKARFPHITYGQDPNSATFKKSYPLTFKNYFFRLVKSYFRQQKQGIKRMHNPAPTFLISSGKAKCLMHINYACPDDCTYATFNKKIVLRSQRMKRLFKEPNSFRSRVWRRNDFKEALDKVLMLNSEKENCHFEPEAGSMSRTIDLALKANPNLRKDGFLSEPDPLAFVQKLGSNFDKSHPEVYKAGVLKRAQFMFREGKFDDALKRLYEGFNVESIRKRYEPQEMKKMIVQNLFKKKENSATRPVTGAQRIDGLKDEHESQKKRPEEDFENKKLLPILQEAYYLIKKIWKRKEDTQAKIKRIEKKQQSLRQQLKSFSVYKRSQSRSDYSDKIIYKTIMCPLKEKCPHDIRPRWPTSNTKAITKFGKECPFAHHPMELKFPETLITNMKASFQTIKNLNDKLDQEKPREAFKPSGKLFECSGCMEKSSMHLGGPCNMCRYKDMAKRSSEKFNNKQRKNSLMKKMARRESKEAKEDKKEMHEIMSELKLDDNYTKKFGLLKKSCVLYFYGRYGDAFEQIANAAEIIKNQREIEKHKQTVIERRWKFKLGMDEGFEFPMPLDQIDPHKVDEKFLKKLDLQGVSVSTLKLYIEQVAPQNQDEYSKHKFLNKCIEDFYLQCEAMLEDKTKTIAKMKKQVELLDEMADQMDSMGAGGESSPDRSPEKGGDMSERKFKPKKTKMCKEQVDKHRCSTQIQYRTQYNQIMKQYARSRSTKREDIEKEQKELQTDLQKLRKCNLAHTPIDLDLIPVETKMKNLQGVIHSQTLKLKNMKPLEPWRPVKSGEIIHTHLMDMSSKGRKKKGSDGEDEEESEKRKIVKKKSIFDRENIHRKPFDVNE